MQRCSVDADDASVGFSFNNMPKPKAKPKPLVIPHHTPMDVLRTPTRADRASVSRLASRFLGSWVFLVDYFIS